MIVDAGTNLGAILKRQRVSLSLTITQLATETGVSPSHLGRIERGERFPSARVLRKIAKPLGFDDGELFMLAGFLSGTCSPADIAPQVFGAKGLDPSVAAMLAQEPARVQRATIGILSILKSLSNIVTEESG